MTLEIVGQAITGQIEILAPPEKVFDALVDPEQLVQWWGSADTYRTSGWKLDLREGGEWSCQARGVAGNGGSVHGRYLVVDRPRALAYTWNPSWAPGEESQVHYTFVPIPAGTRVEFRHDGFQSEKSRAGHAEGWQRVVAWLQNYLQAQEVEK